MTEKKLGNGDILTPLLNDPLVQRKDLLLRVKGLVDADQPPVTSSGLIVVLGVSMDFDSQTNSWTLPDIVQSDPLHVVGGNIRRRAVLSVIDHGFQGTIAVTGGTQVTESGKRGSRTEVLTRAIDEGSPNKTIDIVPIGTENNGHTLGNLNDTVTFLKSRPDIPQEEIVVLANRWQLERAGVIFADHLRFQEERSLRFTSAEDILLALDPTQENRQMVVDFTSHPLMPARRVSEQNGIRDYVSGKYQPKS